MRWAVVLGLAAVVTGCSSGDPPDLDPLTKAELAALPSADVQQMQALIGSHQGKVVVLAVWSAAAGECEGLFPALATLAQGAPGVAVITLSVDRVDDVRAKALPIVKEHGEPFENRVFGCDAMEVEPLLRQEWAWRVPAIAVYDKKGEKAEELYGRGAVARAGPVVEKLLGKKR